MSEEKKVEVPVMEVSNAKGSQKTAPKGIVIKGEVGGNVIAKLEADNPKKVFVKAAPGSSDASLESIGLIPVKRDDGSNVLRKGMVICEQVGSERTKEIKEQYDMATRQIDAVREKKDPASVDVESQDVTAKRKKPKKTN